MEANNNYLVDFSKEYTYVASESLVQSAKGNNSDIYLNFAYTDYSGSFLDKVIISYFKEYYPENIVHEEASSILKKKIISSNLILKIMKNSNIWKIVIGAVSAALGYILNAIGL